MFALLFIQDTNILFFLSFIFRLYIQLDNLFNGNKVLGDTMNSFMNENWKEIFDELKPGILEALGSVIVNIANNVFDRVPYDTMFDTTV